MPTYVPGARGVPSGPPPIKLSSNENPYNPLPAVVDAIKSAAVQANRYPDMFAVELTERIGERHSMSADRVVVAAGSVAVLAHVLQAYCAPGDEVVFAWRSFEAYPILTLIAGAEPVAVPLTEQYRHDLSAMAAAITERTKVVLVCSPNNPTGPAIRHDEFVAFMDDVPSHVLVVLDEAYVEFVTDGATVDGRAMVENYSNVLVLRTFSKAYGLAGLRVGYCMGTAAVVAPVRACVTPFSLSGVAQAAALASLEAEDHLLERVAAVVEQRERVLAQLAQDGWNIPVAQGNFFWIPAGAATQEIADFCAASTPSILVRPFAGEGVRVTVGDSGQNDAVVAALARYPTRV